MGFLAGFFHALGEYVISGHRATEAVNESRVVTVSYTHLDVYKGQLTSAWIETPMACRTRPPRLVALSRAVSYTHLQFVPMPRNEISRKFLMDPRLNGVICKNTLQNEPAQQNGLRKSPVSRELSVSLGAAEGRPGKELFMR